jgi:hypothetical protein
VTCGVFVCALPLKNGGVTNFNQNNNVSVLL